MIYRKCYLPYRKRYLPYRKRYLSYRKRNLNGRGALPEAGLPSPSSLRDATSPKVRGLGSPRSFRFYTLRPAAARGAVRRYAQTFRLCQGLPLWGSWREAPERARTLAGRLCPGLADTYDGIDFQKAQSELTRCAAGSGLALSVIALRCHLSQSERPWQSAKFAVRHFTPCCRKGSRQALRSDFKPLPRALPLGELDAVRRPERARALAGRLRLSLVGANDGADFRKA